MSRQQIAKEMIAVALLADTPALVWGQPGVGKSSFIHTLGEKLGYKVHVIIGSLCDPTDLKGLPYIDGSSVKFARPYFITDALNEKVMLFFDELTLAPKAVRDAILRLTLEKAVDDVKLPSHTRIISAANPPDIAQGWELSLPLANRFVHIEFPAAEPSTLGDFYRSGMTRKLIDADEAIASRLSQVWDADQTPYRLKWGSLVATYIERVNPSALMQLPREGAQFPDNLAYPTPRSWEFVVRLAAAADLYAGIGVNEYRLTNLHSALLVGTIGHGVGRAFATWAENLDVPDPLAVVEGKVAFPSREDIQFLVIDNIVNIFRASMQSLKASDSKARDSSKKTLHRITSFIVKLYHELKRRDLTMLILSRINSILQTEHQTFIGVWLFPDNRPDWVAPEVVPILKEVTELRKRLVKD